MRFVDAEPEAVAAAITRKTKAVYTETIGNPDLRTTDIAGMAEVAHAAGVPLILDNTLPTPYLVRPIEHGADIVVYSATKFIGGHGTSIGGIVVDGGTFDWAASGRFPDFTTPDPSYHGVVYNDVFNVENFGANIQYGIKLRVQMLRDIGAAMSPFNAWLFLQGLETLPLRMERHSQNAAAVAHFMVEHPKIAWVNYPGLAAHPSYAQTTRYFRNGLFGAIVGFGLRGGMDEGKRFIDNLQLFSTWRTSATPSRWPFILRPPLIRNSPSRSRFRPASPRTTFGFRWASSRSATSWQTSIRRCAHNRQPVCDRTQRLVAQLLLRTRFFLLIT